MMDQYKEQYGKETEQIHAPVDLIARTKAAMREEEARIQRDRPSQTPESESREISVVERKHSPGAAARKWAYPLTAVAAVLVLVSVSLMMRGLGKSDSDSARYESAASADSGGEEESALTEGTEESASVTEEAGAAAPADEMDAAGMFDGAVPETAAEADTEMASDSVDSQDMAATGGIAELEDETKRAATPEEASSESTESQKTVPQKQEMSEDLSAWTEDVEVERVWKKPAFANRADTELHTYKDFDFQVIREEDGWIAYVESEQGGGYILRGEMETLEIFLEEGYKRLSEISY